MHAADRLVADMRLKRGEPGAVEEDRLHSEPFELLGLGVRQILPVGAAIRFDPAAGAQKRGGAGVLSEPQVLAGRGGQERGHDLAGRFLSCLSRGLEIAPDRRRDRRQRAMADVGARIAVHGRPRDLAQRAREEIGEDPFALDDAAIAEAGLARRFRQTVDERDGSAARRKRERRRDADNSRAKHDGVDGVRGHRASSLLFGRAAIGRALLNSGLPFL